MSDAPTPADSSPASDVGEQLILNSPEDAKTPKDFVLWAGVIVLAVLCAFSPAMHGKYLWDDDRHVENNRDLRDASGLGDIWTGHWRLLTASEDQRKQIRDVYTPQYYPFTHTTYWIEAQIFGTSNPTVFHVTNMVLHAAAAVLLWFILRELAVPGAWVAAAIFAVHPMNVESVAWISERKNVLAGALYAGALFAYLKSPMGLNRDESVAAKDRDLTLYFVAIGLFILAVLSKTVACSLPAVVLLILWWKRGKVRWDDVAWTAPMFVVGLALSMFTSWIEVHHIGASGPEWSLNPTQRILLAGNAIWFYAAKLLVPLRLTFIYPKWNLDPGSPELWIGPIAVVAVLAALLALRKRIGRGPLVGALIFCGVLVPALGFFNVYPMRYSYVADHFQYLAGPAFIALVVALLAKLVKKLPMPGPYVVSGVVLVVLAVLTGAQSTIFAGPLELWADTAKKNPNSAMVRYNVGLARFRSAGEFGPDEARLMRDRLEQARGDFEAATKLDENHDRAWQMWGETLLTQGKPQEAIEKFDHVLAMDAARWSRGEIKPAQREPAVDAAMGRGQALVEQKKTDDALAAYRQAIGILESQRPSASRIKAATSFGVVGKLLAQKGDTKGATENLQQAIKIEPKLAFPHYEMGQILASAGKKPEAAVEFANAMAAQPAYIEPRLALGRLMLSVDNLGGAQQQFVAAARINPYYPGVREAAEAFDAAVKKATTRAATRAATMRAATQSAATRSNSKFYDATLAMTSIRLQQLSKSFGTTVAVKSIDLQIASGELFFLLGPSGCGKSTLLRLIAGLMEPTSGRIFFNDHDVTRLPTQERNAVMVFQSYALWPHMTVAENVRFGLAVRGEDRDSQLCRAEEVLTLVRMQEYANRKPNELSGGQQQRVALARALAVKPACLLLDEPLSNLDAKLRQEMRSEIRRICKQAGLTTVYVTHDQKEALSIADRIAVMRAGAIEQVGTASDVYHRPVNEFVREFMKQDEVAAPPV